MSPRGGTPSLHFRAGPAWPEIQRRMDTTPDETSPGAVAQRDLLRYYTLLAAGRAELRESELTLAEACALCDVLNGAMLLHDANGTRGLPLDVRNSIALELDDAERLTGLGAKWDVDVDQLIRRIQRWSVAAGFAMADAAEQFWRDPNSRPPEDVLREIGVLPPAEPAASSRA